MTFKISFTASKRDAGGKGSAFAQRDYSTADKLEVNTVESALIQTLVGMNAMAKDVNEQKAKAKAANEVPVKDDSPKHTLHLHYHVTEHGKLWTGVTFEYPNMSDEMSSTILGMLDEQLDGTGLAIVKK